MELVIAIVALVGLNLAWWRWGAESREGFTLERPGILSAAWRPDR